MADFCILAVEFGLLGVQLCSKQLMGIIMPVSSKPVFGGGKNRFNLVFVLLSREDGYFMTYEVFVVWRA